MSSQHKTANDFIPVARAMTEDAFCARFDHPFLFGREVLEEEFRFQTLVTRDQSLTEGAIAKAVADSTDPEGQRAGGERHSTDVFRIRHWIIPVKKPDGAPAQDRIFLGRGESNDICVPHRTVSKLHGYFIRDPRIVTRWFLVDTGSANGTKTNGMRVPPRARVALVDGDTVSFGRCVFQWMSAKSLHDRLLAMAGPQPGMDLSDD